MNTQFVDHLHLKCVQITILFRKNSLSPVVFSVLYVSNKISFIFISHFCSFFVFPNAMNETFSIYRLILHLRGKEGEKFHRRRFSSHSRDSQTVPISSLFSFGISRIYIQTNMYASSHINIIYMSCFPKRLSIKYFYNL